MADKTIIYDLFERDIRQLIRIKNSAPVSVNAASVLQNY